MNILAIDSSSKAASCGIWTENNLACEYYLNNQTTHSQTLLPMIENALLTCNLRITDMDYIAITTGPGSFTGLRIGLATVKGLAYAHDIKVIAVPTLKSIAYNLSDCVGTVIAVMDARRNQVYTAVYHAENGLMEPVLQPTTLLVSELEEFVGTGPAYFVGDGAEMCYSYFKDKFGNIKIAQEKSRHQHASSMIELVLKEKLYETAVKHQDLTVEYLRIPQAQRELQEGIK